MARTRQQNKLYMHRYRAQKPLVVVWTNMMQRCNNPTTRSYKDYGERGIKVCKRWHTYRAFEADMLPTYRPRLQLERNDNDGDYTPENCRWVTRLEQSKNRRATVLLTYKGKTLTMKDWSRELGIGNTTLWWRIHNCWPVERALSKGGS